MSDAIVEPERQQDPKGQGVAIVLDVDGVTGLSAIVNLPSGSP